MSGVRRGVLRCRASEIQDCTCILQYFYNTYIISIKMYMYIVYMCVCVMAYRRGLRELEGRELATRPRAQDLAHAHLWQRKQAMTNQQKIKS